MSSVAAVEGPRRRVLVVDDDQLVLRFIARVLRRLGFEAVAAQNAFRAYNLFQRHASELALIVVALSLPGVGGGQLVNRLPIRALRIPVLFTTCLGERGRNLAGPILQKPFSAPDLERAVCDYALARHCGELL